MISWSLCVVCCWLHSLLLLFKHKTNEIQQPNEDVRSSFFSIKSNHRACPCFLVPKKQKIEAHISARLHCTDRNPQTAFETRNVHIILFAICPTGKCCVYLKRAVGGFEIEQEIFGLTGSWHKYREWRTSRAWLFGVFVCLWQWCWWCLDYCTSETSITTDSKYLRLYRFGTILRFSGPLLFAAFLMKPFK